MSAISSRSGRLAAIFECSVAQPVRALRVHAHPGRGEDRDDAPARGDRERALRLVGHAELCAIEADRAERTTAAIEAIAAGIRGACLQFDALVNERLEAIAAQATQIGLAVAREVVGSALDTGLVDPTGAVFECLRAETQGGSSGAEALQVRLSPADADHVVDGLTRHPELLPVMQRVSFETDSALPTGAAEVRSGHGTLRHDPREVLAKLCRAIEVADPATVEPSPEDKPS